MEAISRCILVLLKDGKSPHFLTILHGKKITTNSSFKRIRKSTLEAGPGLRSKLLEIVAPNSEQDPEGCPREAPEPHGRDPAEAGAGGPPTSKALLWPHSEAVLVSRSTQR